MKQRDRDLIRVGAFVLLAVGILAGALLWIAGAHFLRPVSTYTIVFADSVSGLNAGANVEYQGVVVGRVRDIGLTSELPPEVAVVVDLEPETPVRTDTSAALAGSFVTGLQYIQLHGGSTASAPLPSGGTIRGSTASLAALRDRATDIADTAGRVLTRLEEQVLTKENAEALSGALGDLRQVARTLSHAMASIEAEQTGQGLADSVVQLAELAENMNEVVVDFRSRRDEIYGGIQSGLGNFDTATRDAQRLFRTATADVSGTRRSVDDLLRELASLARTMEEAGDAVQRNPSMFLWGRDVPEREFER